MDFFTELKTDRDKTSAVKTISSLPSNYVGSKRRMLTHIWDVIESNDIQFESVLDAFSGSGMVSLLFKHMGKSVISNDLISSSSVTAVSLLENAVCPLSDPELTFLCQNEPKDARTFVLDNYKDVFFTEAECIFLDNYRRNVELLFGNSFYCGKDANDAEKWISIDGKGSADEVNRYKATFALYVIHTHVNQHCFLGGRYYNGQTIAKLEHRLEHQKNKGKLITEIPVNLEKCSRAFTEGNCTVINDDIFSVLENNNVKADMIYLDPPYGGASSDYANLYRFLEEYLYEEKLEKLDHIVQGGKRFAKAKGYREQFEDLLALCTEYPIWMISYNESSWASIDTIKEVIKNVGKKDIMVTEVPITYQYRAGKNEIDVEHFKDSYLEDGHKYMKRGIEYLIVAK